MKIPIDMLDASTLHNIVEAFVLREGTDYGDTDYPLLVKVEQVMQQLRRGDAILVYSELHDTVDIRKQNE